MKKGQFWLLIGTIYGLGWKLDTTTPDTLDLIFGGLSTIYLMVMIIRNAEDIFLPPHQ